MKSFHALSLAVALVAAGAVALTAPADASTPCPVPAFIPGTQLVTAGPNEWLRVTFRVDAPLSATFWGEAAVHWATTATNQPYVGFSAERAVVATFFETADGASLGRDGAMALYPYGVQLDAGDVTLRMDANDGGGCGGVAAGVGLDLEPGTYVMTLLGATDLNGATGAALPDAVTVTHVARGPSERLSETEYDCAAKLRAAASGVASETLVLCNTTYTATGRAFRALSVDKFPDANHQVRWVTPDGETLPNVVFFDLKVGGPGAWKLDIPRYVTPAGQPFYVPLPVNVLGSEGGVFGAFADIP